MKEKFHIPIPDEQMIETEIEQIIQKSSLRHESFFAHMKSMYTRIGFRHLFSDRTEAIYLLFIALAFIFFHPELVGKEADSFYAFLFLVSPLLFTILSIYTYVNKMEHATYEVEMTCKIHVFQVIAFRMFLFSIITILLNAVTIAFIATIHEQIHYVRAFMISTTALFVCSLLFLYTLMKWRSAISIIVVSTAWISGNLMFCLSDRAMYNDVLMNMPLFVYGLVIMIALYLYIRGLASLCKIQTLGRGFL